MLLGRLPQVCDWSASNAVYVYGVEGNVAMVICYQNAVPGI